MTDQDIVKLIKEALSAKIPEWKADYFQRICNKLQVHTKGLLFSKVDSLFPNEHPDSKDHCINTYEPITKGSIWKSINNITRVFTNSSFTVSASEEVIKFINADNFLGQNLFSWFVTKWIEFSITSDPNGYIAIYPKEYTDKFPGDSIRFIRNAHAIPFGQNILLISEAESECSYSTKNSVLKREIFYDKKVDGPNVRTSVEETFNQQVEVKIEKPVYHLFTKEGILRFIQGEEKKYQYDWIKFKKPVSILPAWKLSAPNLVEDINESFVEPFIPFGNLALLQHRNHRAVDLMFSYPRMSEIETPCINKDCHDGFVTVGNEKAYCEKCRGTGYTTVQSPYKVYKKQVDTGFTDPEVATRILQADPVDFHTPDVGILNYSKDSWKEYLGMAEEAVFIQQRRISGDAESAKSKQIDKEGEYSWVQNISKALNTDMRKSIQCFEDFLNVSPVTVAIEQPISFAIVTETEAFEALEIMISSDSPVFVKAQQVDNFIHKFVSKSSPIIKALDVMKAIDPLLYYSNKDVQMFKSNNIVSPDAWSVHILAYPILMQLYREDASWFEKDVKIISEELMNRINLLKPKSASLKENLLNSVA